MRLFPLQERARKVYPRKSNPLVTMWPLRLPSLQSRRRGGIAKTQGRDSRPSLSKASRSVKVRVGTGTEMIETATVRTPISQTPVGR